MPPWQISNLSRQLTRRNANIPFIMASDRIQRQIDRLLDEAEQAITNEDWSTVASRARSVLAIDPENTEGEAYLAAADRALGTSAAPPTSQAPSTPRLTTSATAGQPTSFANGRYQFKQSLGEGGKKKVYLAHDTLLDREVAFALIKTEGLDEAGRSRISREAQAMGRLGSHPHIVTVFDLGQDQDQPYMVTELMGGGDVEGLIEGATDHRVPLEEAIGIAQEVCQGLEFAHGRGIIHRDLKPGNVWLNQDGTAKIGDFGLAVALDRSRLTTEGMMVGTVSYMPPEQAMGGEVTPRSDLYALGAMLHEMVTGRPPFLGDDSVAIIGQHINTPPVAPTWHNGHCPRPLEILRLLAKDPSERPQSAFDVSSALDAIDLNADVGAMHASPLPQDEAHALDSLAGGIFVGRQQEMGELKACLEDALSGRGRMVTLVGEPGIGKSRTAQELSTYAGLRGAQVLWGRCYEEQGAPPYWPWVQAIRTYVRDKEPEELRSEMGPGAEDIAEVVSDVRDRLPGLRTPPQLEPEQARFRLFDSITAFLKSASRRQPLVLVLDDLHWADHPSLLLLEFVARELSGSRLLLVGAYRDMELSRRHPLSLTLGELTRERLFQRVLLRGLSQEDVARFIELVSGVAPPRGMVAAVQRQTEGNPLFVTEVVRLLVQEGIVGASRPAGTESPGDSNSWSVRIPEGVREVIGRRLDRLSERCNETLPIASVIGREFTLVQLKPLIEDMSEDRLLEVLEEALGSRVIEELPQSVGRYQFTHALIQETLAGELSTTRKVRLHARIAQELEDLYGSDAESRAAELAHHFAEAQTVLGTEKLVHYSLLAGERALATYAHAEALAHFQRGLAAKADQPSDSETGQLLYGLGRVQVATLPPYELREAVQTLGQAFDYFVDAGDVDRAVAVAEVPLPVTAGYITGLGQILYRALDIVPADSLQAAPLLASYARAAGLEDANYQAAREALDRALEIARREGDPSLELRVLSFACDVEAYHCRFEQGFDTCMKGIELASQVDDPRSELLVHFWAAGLLTFWGNPEGAARHISAALSAAERLRHHFYLGRVLYVSEVAARLTGNWIKSLDSSDQGLSISPQESRLLAARALLESEQGSFEVGIGYLDQVEEAVRLIPPGPTIAHATLAALPPILSRISGSGHGLDTARWSADVVVSSPSATPLMRLWATPGPSLIAVEQGDAVAAREQYDALVGMPGQEILIVQGISSLRLLGLLAHTMGDQDQAAAHLEDALEFCRKAGYRPELAWTCCDYSDTLRARDAEGDRAKAMALLDESLAVSSELGMRPLMERVLSRREILRA